MLGGDLLIFLVAGLAFVALAGIGLALTGGDLIEGAPYRRR